jgi:S1-C subfamily serine protease
MGIGYAIPVSTARKVMEQIIQKGSVTRGWVGVGVQDMTREIAESFKLPATGGVLITQIERGGPAEKGGVKLGDVLLAVNGKPVVDSTGMLNMISALQPGDSAKLKIFRNQSESELTVTIGRRPRPQPQREE